MTVFSPVERLTEPELSIFWTCAKASDWAGEAVTVSAEAVGGTMHVYERTALLNGGLRDTGVLLGGSVHLSSLSEASSISKDLRRNSFRMQKLHFYASNSLRM